MRIPVVIPFKPIHPKTRLSPVLSEEERTAFALCMLRDVVTALRSAGCNPLVLSTAPFDNGDIPVKILEQGLNEAIDTFCTGNDEPLAIVMADLALADRSSVLALLSSGADLAIVPGRGGGTNAVYIRRASRFRAQYYGRSFEKHCRYGEKAGLSLRIIDSFRLYCDVDEKEDLIEVLLHNTGESRDFLLGLGFSPDLKRSRIGVERPATS